MKIKHLLIGILLLSPLSLSAQEIALQLYSLRNEMKVDPVKYHEMIAEWGISALEGGGGYGMSDAEYQKLLADNNLKIVGVGADYNRLKTDPAGIIADAKKYGAKYATCYWIPHAEGPISMEEMKAATDLFNQTGELLAKEGITLTYHPHGYEFQNSGQGTPMDYMLANAKYFQFNMDVFWVKMGGGDPLAIMKAHPGKFPQLHLKDRKIGTPGSPDGRGDVETNVVLGTGDIDIAGLIQEAKKQGTKYLVIEDESSRSVAQIPQSVAFIKKELEK
ncbi:sugar phosphate isomerase/epimerase family protein [Algoriphagus boritolerans]|uniref:Sugar phosphate isomerase/epimerase n=1 Tax=Algoriphagus boritolerans DSM 17298 = JCM 18970 TaxID=1120964 RepID=A0A1H5ZLW5_9BACT|nr:sugar phosphate isomerase/epimerase [Algoriphagus boritolerans]SEG36346.1 Sugar phosphate isomerase/epimerase [Algoriphagus boritolerans DSM 17298 = JCM 18970]